jgi:hypothetical protein
VGEIGEHWRQSPVRSSMPSSNGSALREASRRALDRCVAERAHAVAAVQTQGVNTFAAKRRKMRSGGCYVLN